MKKILLDKIGVDKLLLRISHEIVDSLGRSEKIAVIGIRTRGDIIAKRIVDKIALNYSIEVEYGVLDVTFHRDDFSSNLGSPKVGPSNAINLEEQILETCMMEHLIERNPHKPQEEIANIITEDKYFNAVWATWGYVMTAHKAQGGEWDTILADFREGFSNNASWRYTAVTRARKKLYINASEGLLKIGENINSDAKQNTLPKKLLDIVENLSEEEKNLLIKSIENKKIEKEEKNSDIHTYTKEEALMLAEKLPIPYPSTWAEHRKVNPRYQATWSLEEDNIIISLIKSGMSVIEISKVLKRNTGAIGAKWKKLHENNIVEMNDDDLKRYTYFSRKEDHNEESIYKNFDEDTPF